MASSFWSVMRWTVGEAPEPVKSHRGFCTSSQQAWKGAGDSARANTFAAKAANFNGLSFNYAYVRNKARKLSGT